MIKGAEYLLFSKKKGVECEFSKLECTESSFIKTRKYKYNLFKILNIRPIARSLLSYEVGDGRNIFLWHDSWHPNGGIISCLWA